MILKAPKAMKIKNALLSYYGAKCSQAKGIVAEIGDHRVYWELFGGSAAVLLAKPAVQREMFNDLHGGVVNLARVVQDDRLAPELFDRVQRTLFAEPLHRQSCDWLKNNGFPAREVCLDAAYHYLVASWMGRGGMTGTEKELDVGFSKRFTSDGGDSAVRWRSVVESIPWWWRRLRGVTVLQEDAFGLLAKIEDREGTVIFLDSPYVVKSVEYAHDFDPKDHERLAAAVSRFRHTKVIMAYYRNPILEDLYPANVWRWVDRSTAKKMSNGRTTAEEILLVRN